MQYPIWPQDMGIQIKETGSSQPSADIADARARVRKGEPEFANFGLTKIARKLKNRSSQKSHVGQALRFRLVTSYGEAIAFQIDADEVGLGKSTRQSDGVLPSPAAQLYYDWVLIPEIILPPTAANGRQLGMPVLKKHRPADVLLKTNLLFSTHD